MPPWAIVIVSLATVLVAMVTLWQKAIKPMALTIAEANNAVPVMRALVDAFSGDPNVLAVLQQIAAQFRTDSGSSLRDVVNSLAEAAEANRVSNEQLSKLLKELTDKVDDQQPDPPP